jgi:hypothetical protein
MCAKEKDERRGPSLLMDYASHPPIMQEKFVAGFPRCRDGGVKNISLWTQQKICIRMKKLWR